MGSEFCSSVKFDGNKLLSLRHCVSLNLSCDESEGKSILKRRGEPREHVKKTGERERERSFFLSFFEKRAATVFFLFRPLFLSFSLTTRLLPRTKNSRVPGDESHASKTNNRRAQEAFCFC